MPPYTSSQAAMSNFTPAAAAAGAVASCCLKGFVQTLMQIYILGEEIFCILCLLLQCAVGVCFIFARREYPLHTSSHSYPFITRPAQVQSARGYSTPAERERELSVEIGGEMETRACSASLNLHLKTLGAAGWCSTFVRRKSPEKVHLHNFHINSGPVYSWHLWLIWLSPSSSRGWSFEFSVLSSTQKHCAGLFALEKRCKSYLSPHDDRAKMFFF